MKQIEFWSRKFFRRAVQLYGGRFYVNPDPDIHKSILIAGTARSGTTWLADLIRSQVSCRLLLEPFNPELVREYQDFHYFHYMRPEWEDQKLYAFARAVFSGEIRNRWIDRQNETVHGQYRLIKEVRANLLLKWLHERFPEVPLLFLVRHPCAVVLSRMQLGWYTDHDIQPFLSQPELITDHLAEHIDLIRGAKTEEEKHAVIWCVSNLVPLRQFPSGELNIVYYEELCTRPETELPAIFKAIGQEYTGLAVETLNRPSHTTKITSAVVAGTDKIGTWKLKLTSTQIDNILRIVDAFGLSHLYGDSVLPTVRQNQLVQ